MYRMGDEDDEDDSDEEIMDEDDRPSSSGEAGDADVVVTTPEQVEPSLGPSITSSQVEVVETLVTEAVVTETEVDDTVLGVHSSEKVTVTTETSVTVSTVTTDVNEEAAKGVAIEGESSDASTIEVVPASCVSDGQSLEKGTTVPSTVDSIVSPVLKGNKGSEVVQDEPLDFSSYQSAEELEV